MSINETITIGCVGMTHLGLVHAMAFAEKGFQLVCFDENAVLIEQLQQRQLPVTEPSLLELCVKNTSRLVFTNDVMQLNRCDLVFIACDVPTDEKGNSDLDVIDALIARVAPVLMPNTSLIILSQVPPGYTRRIDFAKNRLFYQVETLIFGQALERALHPERYIVGAHDPSGQLSQEYSTLLSAFDCPILLMRYESAELAKISINMFLVSSVTTTNTLAEICENIGADWDEIAKALRLDRRIGPFAYLSPGLGVAGGNLERDLNTVIKLGKVYDIDTGVVSSWLHNSEYRRDWVLRCLERRIFSRAKNAQLSVLGLSYKPDTHSIKNSPSIALLKVLIGHTIKTHDPVVRGAKLKHTIHQASVVDAIKDADVVIVMTPWAEYKALSIDFLLEHMRGNTIIDPYRIFNSSKAVHAGCNYFTLGQREILAEQKELTYA
jgi:UDPglucose 6-dehydrogenase